MTTELFLPGDFLRVKRLTFTESGGNLTLTALNLSDMLTTYIRPGDQVLYIAGLPRTLDDEIVWHLILAKGVIGAVWFSSVVFTHEL